MENDIIVYGYGAAGLPVVQQFWWGHTFHAWAGGHNVWEALTGEPQMDRFCLCRRLRAYENPLGREFPGRRKGAWVGLRRRQGDCGQPAKRLSSTKAPGRCDPSTSGPGPCLGTWYGLPCGEMTYGWQPAVGCGEGFAISSDLSYRDQAVSFADFVFFGERRDILKWADKPGLIATYLPPMDYEASDFPPGFNPVYKQSILESVAAQKNRDFGFLPWAAWPNRTNNYLSNISPRCGSAR